MSEVEIPDVFDFPFIPYKIQHEFMRELYAALEQKKCGIFESPTGTGKSLSIICGAVRWLKDHNIKERLALETKINELTNEKEKLASKTVDWLTSQSKEIEVTRTLNAVKLQNTKVADYYQKIETLQSLKKKKVDRTQFVKNIGTNEKEESSVINEIDAEEDDDDFMLINEMNDNDEESNSDEEEESYSPVKIFICSRTHSQLAQFVGEIRKSPFGEDIRVVTLASRQSYCINPEVRKLKNVNLINERCLDLQKSQMKSAKKDTDGKMVKKQKGANCKCPYYKQQAIEELRVATLVEVQDIEDLVKNARLLSACPYYSSRKAVEDAEVVLVPYNTILHRGTREANGIKLKNNVVIIDEAHNLLEALGQMYGSEVNFDQLFHAHQQLKSYKAKYSMRFSAKNLLCINQLIFVTARLKEELERKVEINGEIKTQFFSIQNFVLSAEIDNYNMFKLVKFVKDTKISQKVHKIKFCTMPVREGFFFSDMLSSLGDRASGGMVVTDEEQFQKRNTYKQYLPPRELSISEKKNPSRTGTVKRNPCNCTVLHSFALKFPEALDTKMEPKKGVQSFLASIENKKKLFEAAPQQSPMKIKLPPSNPLLAVVSFLESLTYSYSDGRILVHRGENKKLQFLLLNSSTHFKDLVNDARSIIVAGGTMKPMSEFRERLFMGAGAEDSRISEFSCDHIIAPENILPLIVTSGPKNEKLLFNFENRFKMGEHLKSLLKDACNTIKGGIVVFFPSYKYELWIWEQVKLENFGRPVFREPKDSASVDSVLENYHKAIYKSECKGALMFSVVGGKLSEGLNFSDDLGRCVIVIGLPYPNIYAPDLKEKMSFLDKSEGTGAGNKFYENMCMKSVNQCIGRAVRHKDDYATVILFDERYNRQSTKAALPDWIKRSLNTCSYDGAFALIKKMLNHNHKIDICSKHGREVDEFDTNRALSHKIAWAQQLIAAIFKYPGQLATL